MKYNSNYHGYEYTDDMYIGGDFEECSPMA